MDGIVNKVLEVDGSEENNPIRMLNVDYDLPVEIGKKLIGKTEAETNHNVELFRQSINKVIHNSQQNYGSYICGKIHDDMIGCLKEIFETYISEKTSLSRMAIFVMMSNMINNTMVKLCKTYKPLIINMESINNSMLNHDNINRCGIKYKEGDKLSGFMIPYGWDKNKDGTLCTNTEENNIVCTIFRLCYSGMSYKNIADYLNERGMFGRNNIKWEVQTIKEIINRGKAL